MTTHRSRNKLERKAHMNMHDILEVPDVESQDHALRYTRDRFGKKQPVEPVEKEAGK